MNEPTRRKSKRRRDPAPLANHVDVAIVGAGVFGAWTAWHLVKAGLKVRLFDAYGAGHARSSSGGESRVIRMAYGADAIYSAMAAESLPYWQALSDSASAPIFHQTGVLWWAPGTDAYSAQSLAWLAGSNTPHESGDANWLQNRWQQIRFYNNERGIFETTAGALIAGRGVQEVVADSGLTVERIVMPAPLPEKSRATHHLPDGGTADHLVYAVGPWLAELFPQQLGGRIVATRQEVMHFGAAQGDNRFAAPQLPVWADFNNGAIVYGIPDIEGQGFKLAFDTHGPAIDPDTHDRRVSEAGVAAARKYLAVRFPALADAPLIHSRVCQYENSSNGDFLIDRLPGAERVWLVGGGSGHGFKHGPAVGKRVAAHVLDAALAVEPRFSLATKGTVAARTVF
ncbi:MAG: FAD-dependent oxidoreductase [Sphingopyxis sp.]|nr:FAD-dependent oxidoreductase [Sphingopyxis sp.]